MTGPRIAQYMTVCPHTIGIDQPVKLAHEFMRGHDVRHLPVLQRGQIVGIVSQRDLYFMETITGADIAGVTVEEAMTRDPYLVDPDASVEKVAEEMARHRYGCAVVAKRGDIVGVFTTTDGMRALAAELAETRKRGARAPSARKRSTATRKRATQSKAAHGPAKSAARSARKKGGR